MLESWSELPAWIRIGSGLVLMLIGIVWVVAGAMGYLDDPGQRSISKVALVMIALGFAMFAIGGQTDSEKNGYRF
jgi:hypothetical protein